MSRYVYCPEPNSHSNMTSDMIAIGFRLEAQALASPDFTRLSSGASHQHHDALSFPDGKTVLLNLLSEGQHARVLQLPVTPREQSIIGNAEKTVILALDPELAA